MPHVDFYVLGDAAADARIRFACKLTEEACGAGVRPFLRTGSPAESAVLDDLLWTFSDRAFLPHEISSGQPPSHPRIVALIGHEGVPADCRALLINLAGDLPADAETFERIAEIVDADPARKGLARERFRLYRDRGFPLVTRNV